MMTQFDFTPKERLELLQYTITKLEAYYGQTKSYNVSPLLNIKKIKSEVRKIDLSHPVEPKKALDQVINGLEQFGVHTPHPKYFGLYNPRSTFPGILSDLITAVFNPQLAAWSHSPFANEVENYLIDEFGKKFGYKQDNIDGVFATGGAEANLTAILCAINHSFVNFAKDGLFGLTKRPVIYCSSEAHHSIDKAAKTVGLGYASVRVIEVGKQLKINLEKLVSAIEKDMNDDHQPFMLIGTAGTTGTGTIDDLVALQKITKKYNLWFHVDAAYGGGAMLSSGLHSLLKGIEQSDSITFDAHKWMSLPMSTSIFITSHKDILGKTFGIITEYMPKEAKGLEITDPFTHSIQWSRRFVGLRLYLSLLIFGWKGYEKVIDHQTNIGEYLRQKLKEHGWNILNDTPLPVVCFTDNSMKNNESFAKTISQNIIKSGKSWISVYPVHGIPALRACITNYNTTEKEIDELVMEVDGERNTVET